MHKPINSLPKKFLLPFIVLTAILLSACGPSASTNSTDTLNAIYTAAAQTVEAQYTADAPTTTGQTATPVPTDTSSEISTPTSLPVLEFATSTSTPYITTSGGTACDDSGFISDVTIPDNTVVPAGQTFVKTWMFQNTGSCTWDASYTLTFINGDQMGGTDTSIGGSVEPGQQAALSVTLTAPTTAGQYTGYWQLASDSGETFGVTVYVLIDVAEDATVTPDTPTATATDIVPTATSGVIETPTDESQPTDTATQPAPTATQSASDTPTPTLTPQPTATSSSTAEANPTNTPVPEPTNTSVPTATSAPTNTPSNPTSTPGD